MERQNATVRLVGLICNVGKKGNVHVLQRLIGEGGSKALTPAGPRPPSRISWRQRQFGGNYHEVISVLYEKEEKLFLPDQRCRRLTIAGLIN